jgi:hypothetical protein
MLKHARVVTRRSITRSASWKSSGDIVTDSRRDRGNRFFLRANK